MHIVALAWMFVVVLMALAEATSPQGTVLGAAITLLLYGVLPLALTLYLLATPARRRARRRAEQQADAASSRAADAHRRGHAPGDAIAPEREEA